MQAETQSMTHGTEESTKIRAAIASARGLQDKKHWEASSAASMKHLWLTDCDSLHSHLINPVSVSVEDKRLETELEALRQDLWEDLAGDPKDNLSVDDPDRVRWIDTSAMVADPLTKRMKADRLVETLATGMLSLEPTPEAILAKMAKQKARRKSDDNVGEVEEMDSYRLVEEVQSQEKDSTESQEKISTKGQMKAKAAKKKRAKVMVSPPNEAGVVHVKSHESSAPRRL